MRVRDDDAAERPDGSLVDSPEFWRSVADAVPDMVLLVDRDARIFYVNQSSATAAERMVGRSALDFVADERRDEVRHSLGNVFRGEPVRMRELRAVHDDGSIRWYATHTGPVRLDGEVVAALVVARDVTERARAQAALAESEARFQTLIEHAPEALVVFDVDAERFVDANQNACELFELPLNRLLSRTPAELSPEYQPDGRPSAVASRELLGQALVGGTPVFEWVHRSASGRDAVCEVRLVRLPAAGRRLVRGSIIDRTQQRRTERQMVEWQRLDALGQLAAGIAHDFNNVLSVIGATAQLIVEDESATEDVRTDARAILTEGHRGASLAKQLLSFARSEKPTSEVVDVNDVVSSLTRILRRIVGREIRVVESLHPVPLPVDIHRNQLEQVVMNLVINARDAVQHAGTISVTTRLAATGEVQLVVSDNGCGMDDELRERALEPFFTTKGSARGTGLGLSTVNTIVTRAGGSITITSAPNAGTTCEVSFTRASAKDSR